MVDGVALLGVARAGGQQGDLARLPALVQEGLGVGGGDRFVGGDVDHTNQRAGSTAALAAGAVSATPPGIGHDSRPHPDDDARRARAKQATARAEFPADGFRGVAPAKA